MKIGDLVKNLKSDRGLLGLIVDWTDNRWPDNFQVANHPIVLWLDGCTTWIEAHHVEVICESR
ncbi:MAG: hypothetical protein CBC29_06285 [Methylococcaceae bacterium TMED69]|nr:MAG: hypothetical protein CBC29_06285 [Methylococcaceae bacterium TMED69]